MTLGIPLNSDIQPFAGLFAIIYLLLNITTIKLNKTMIVLFFFSVLFITISMFGAGESKAIYKALSFPYALLIYAFIFNTLNDKIISHVKKYMYLYIFVVLLQLILPSLYVSLFSNLVREIKVQDISGIRGVSALTSEPSFTALVLFIFILIARYTNAIKIRSHMWLIIAALGFGIFATKAVTGYLFLFAFLGIEVVQRITLRSLLIVCAGVIIFMVSNFEKSRSIQFVVMALQSPENILYESSLFYRVYYIVFGYVSLGENPGGMILGSVDIHEIKNLTDSIFVGHTFPHLFARLTPGLNIPSTLGMGLMLYGVFYLLCYMVLFIPIYIKKNVPIIVKLLIFALTVQSFSFAFPLLWFLVATSEKDCWGNPNFKR